MTRVFLDANVLFSAAYRENSPIVQLWQLAQVQLVTSPYAREEAERNVLIKRPDAIERFQRLADALEISPSAQSLREDFGLPDKDLPIVEAALGAGCTVLLTGDVTHFGHLIGQVIEGIQILTVSSFLKGRS